MRHRAIWIAGLGLGAALGFVGSAVRADGDLAQRAERLEPLLLDAASGFSWTERNLRTGIYYRWRIESDGKEEYKLLAPGLFANSWVHQVSMEDLEVKPMGLHAVEFDDAGVIDIWFVPIRPGVFDFHVEGLESLGFRGAFTVE